MNLKPLHISTMDHLRSLVDEAIFFTRDRQLLQVTLTGIVIKKHVEFIGTTDLSSEEVPDMLLAALATAKKLTPFVHSDSMGAIILYHAQLISDLVLRNVEGLSDQDLREFQGAVEESLRTSSREPLFEQVLQEPILNKDGAIAAISQLHEHLREIARQRA